MSKKEDVEVYFGYVRVRGDTLLVPRSLISKKVLRPKAKHSKHAAAEDTLYALHLEQKREDQVL